MKNTSTKIHGFRSIYYLTSILVVAALYASLSAAVTYYNICKEVETPIAVLKVAQKSSDATAWQGSLTTSWYQGEIQLFWGNRNFNWTDFVTNESCIKFSFFDSSGMNLEEETIPVTSDHYGAFLVGKDNYQTGFRIYPFQINPRSTSLKISFDKIKGPVEETSPIHVYWSDEDSRVILHFSIFVLFISFILLAVLIKIPLVTVK